MQPSFEFCSIRVSFAQTLLLGLLSQIPVLAQNPAQLIIQKRPCEPWEAFAGDLNEVRQRKAKQNMPGAVLFADGRVEEFGCTLDQLDNDKLLQISLFLNEYVQAIYHALRAPDSNHRKLVLASFKRTDERILYWMRYTCSNLGSPSKEVRSQFGFSGTDEMRRLVLMR